MKNLHSTAGKVAKIRSHLVAVVDSGTVSVTMAPACPVLLDEFQFLQPSDEVRTLGEVRATMYLLFPCSSWLLKVVEKGLTKWVEGVVNASLQRVGS